MKIFLSKNWVFAVLSGLLLGFSFPPSPVYSLVYVSFIPFLFLFSKVNSYQKIFIYSYLFLFVFNLITAYWIGGFVVGKDIWMMIAGGVLILVHPLFYIPFILISFAIKNKWGINYGLISFPFLWTSFEYLHSLTEYAFPWFTLGNSQAYDLYRIQIIEYVSIYGLTFFILSFNIIAFIFLWRYSNNELKVKSKKAFTLILLLLIIYFVPYVYGKYVVELESEKEERKIRVGVIQPNFDPWEKWGEKKSDIWDSYLLQFDTFIESSKEIASQKPDIIFWPETAIPFHILLPQHSIYYSRLKSFTDSLQIPIFTGLPTAIYYTSENAPVTAQKVGNYNLYVESYNSAMLIEPNKGVSNIYRKIILVPFAERIPYAETFSFLIEPLKWNVGISNWGKGKDTVIFSTSIRNEKIEFAGIICYESVFPQYVRELVNRGAEFLVIVTNDSWWGNTSGAYQHAAYASLRAVEVRKWILQSSNGGISLVVDPAGRVRRQTKLYSVAKFVDELGCRNDKTFYMKYGDIIGQICLFISSVFIFSLMITRRRKK